MWVQHFYQILFVAVVNCNMVMYLKYPRGPTLSCGTLVKDHIILTTVYPILTHNLEKIVAVPAGVEQDVDSIYYLGEFVRPEPSNNLIVVRIIDRPVHFSGKSYMAMFTKYAKPFEVPGEQCSAVLHKRAQAAAGRDIILGQDFTAKGVKSIQRMPETVFAEYTTGIEAKTVQRNDDALLVSYDVQSWQEALRPTCMVDNGLPLICSFTVFGLLDHQPYAANSFDSQIYQAMTSCYADENTIKRRYVNLYASKLKEVLKTKDPELFEAFYHAAPPKPKK